MAEENTKLKIQGNCDLCKFQFNSNIALEEHMRNEHVDSQVIRVGPGLQEKDKDMKIKSEVQLNYILDELKNTRVAKTNARKAMEPKRIDTNDINVRFEMNSALYLVSKEELMKLAPGQTALSGEVKLEVEGKTDQIDKVNNNPVSVIRLKVTQVKTSFESKVTINLYHSNQGVHVQGGRRNGQVTSCSLVANFLQEYFSSIYNNHRGRVQIIQDCLLTVDLRKNYGLDKKISKGKKMEKDMKAMFTCTECHYKSVLQTDIRRHMYKQHNKEKLISNLTIVTKENKAIKALESVQPDNDEDSTQGKSECLDCYFCSDSEHDLDTHLKEKYNKPAPSQLVMPQCSSCNNCNMKDISMKEYSQKIERLELQLTDLEIALDMTKHENKNESDAKKVLEKEYQEAVVVIATQQRKITESNEKIKVYESLEKVDNEKSELQANPTGGEVEEVWEDKDDSSGELVRQQRTELDKYNWRPANACTSCNKVLGSDQHLRQHMKEHHRQKNQMIKCHYCDFNTNDADLHMSHVSDTHSPKYNCRSCDAVFPTPEERIKHATDIHGFKYSETKDIDCHDCEDRFSNKFQPLEHKKAIHYKKRLCSYYHGTGWGCRYPRTCLNIHNENITPMFTNDNRSRIPCRHGDSCQFNRRNVCHYKHNQIMPEPSALPMEPDTKEIPLLDRMKCSQCSYETNTNTELKYHTETQHGVRHKETRGINAIRYPVGHAQWAANRNTNTAEYKCKECISVFTVESMMTQHINSVHNTNYKYTCTHCKNVFSTNVELNAHVHKIHNNGMEAAVIKISQQLDTMGKRLESLESSSLTHFPNLGPQLNKK